MERLAFGPPPLQRGQARGADPAGRVDLAHLQGLAARGDSRSTPCCPARRSRALIDQLLRDGHLHVAEGRRGVVVEPTRQLAPGLAVIGRSTEDWVIGNDTLNRTLHEHADRWARRVAARIDSRRRGRDPRR